MNESREKRAKKMNTEIRNYCIHAGYSIVIALLTGVGITLIGSSLEWFFIIPMAILGILYIVTAISAISSAFHAVYFLGMLHAIEEVKEDLEKKIEEEEKKKK